MNVPLKDGIDDQSYAALFKPVMRKLIQVYQPTAVVFQSGESAFLLSPRIPHYPLNPKSPSSLGD